jgi:hypothetical protein
LVEVTPTAFVAVKQLPVTINLQQPGQDANCAVTWFYFSEPKQLDILNKALSIKKQFYRGPRNSTFENTMPMLKKENVGAINWGLVEGKTNTKYACDTPVSGGAEPPLWFHEVFRKDGTPYKIEETALIKALNGKQ